MAPPTHMNLMCNLLRAVQELSRQNQAPPPQNALPQQNAPHFAPGAVSMVEQFRRYKPSTFDGNFEPLVVEEWIRGLERIFRRIACTNAQKVLCVEFMLIGAADHWWESVSRTRMEEQQRNLAWEQFKDEVMLLRYAPHLVDTEVKKIRRFENGLRPEIGMIIMSQRFTSYREMLERAHAISYKRTSFEQGECLLGKNMCFRCGNLGHIALNCTEPPKKIDDDQDKNKKAKARVFALNQHEVEQDLNVIAGILLLSNVPAYVLFDSGATNSFISTSFVARSNLACVKTNYELEVSIPSGRTLCTNRMTKAMKLEIEGENITSRLIPFGHERFRCYFGHGLVGT
ncbi:uncharacterized protein LOC111378027 [Olea europaea var. sylvestris]|uniref:uncharacterized protein LOC111378027 n=1 Tax=Olea europaea var. sylvestris TaxID=158386 RepID=UPI000C1CE1CA|nr:uncharacterized protein LOC111378027 [Olea europaea var. sylvestris]